jgi:hypothetical protein
MTSEEAPVAVRFPHRSKRGVLLGLTWPQLVVAATILILLLLTMMTLGLVGALKLIPIWAALSGLVIVRYRGRSLAEWTPIAGRFAARRARGQLVWLARPATRPRLAGVLHLPGTAASVRVVTTPDGELAAVHDPHAATLTAVVRIASRAFALLDPGMQNHNVHGWGRVLASMARTGQIARLQVLERTVPSSGDALQRYWAEHGNPDAPLAANIYTDLLTAAGPAAAPHEAYVAVALDLTAARRLINQAGGGITGALTVLSQLTSTFDHAARPAGLTPTGWLTAPEIAAVIRSAYDPASLTALDRWSDDGLAQADPAAAGPVMVVEEADRIRTDTAFHATYWVENWPRTETHAGFLHQLCFTSGVRRTLSLIYTPQKLEAALRDVQRRKATVLADANERIRRGQVDSESDSVEYADIKQRERELIAGHADVGMTGLVTVSAETSKDLDAACSQIETASVAALVDLRRLTWQQSEAFTTAALPIARAA